MSINEIKFIEPALGEPFNLDLRDRSGAPYWYHGTTSCFSGHIEEKGFVPSHQFLSKEEAALMLRKLKCPQPLASLSFTNSVGLALTYSCNDIKKGGCYRTYGEIATGILKGDLQGYTSTEIDVLKSISDKFAPIPKCDGVIYVVEIDMNELKASYIEGGSILHLRAPDCLPATKIVHKIIIPKHYTYR